MRLANVAALASILALSGCWPHIPGPWSDYDVPDETQIIGSIAYMEALGGYWSDPADGGAIAFAWLETPEVGLHAYTPQLGCVAHDGDPVIPSYLNFPGEGFLDVGTNEVTLRSSLGVMDVPFDADGYFYAEFGRDLLASNAAWTMDPVPSSEGEFSVAEFVVMAPRLTFGPYNFEGDAPPTAARGDVTLTWAAAEGAQHVRVDLFLMSANGEPLEGGTCWADAKDGAVTIPASLWGDLDASDAVYINMASVTETESAITGVYGGSRMGSYWITYGFLSWE